MRKLYVKLTLLVAFSLLPNSASAQSTRCADGDLFQQHRCLLARAIWEGNNGRVRQLLRTVYVNLNETRIVECGSTTSFLTCAIRAKNYEAFYLLLDAGTDPNLERNDGLHTIAEIDGELSRSAPSRLIEIYSALLERGLNPNANMLIGNNIPLFWFQASYCSHPSIEVRLTIARLIEAKLKEKNIDPFAIELPNNITIFHSALYRKYPCAARFFDEYYDYAKNGAKLFPIDRMNQRDAFGFGPVGYATSLFDRRDKVPLKCYVYPENYSSFIKNGYELARWLMARTAEAKDPDKFSNYQIRYPYTCALGEYQRKN